VWICWTLGLALVAWVSVAREWKAAGWLSITMLDVGHGDCIIVDAPPALGMIVDTGTQDAGRARLIPYLQARGARSVGALILTHPDEDHIGGASAVLRQWPVAMLLTNGAAGDTMSARRLERTARRCRVPRVQLAAGMQLQGPQGVTIDVLHPPRGLIAGVAPDSNDNSLVLRLTKGAISVLLTGDIEEEGLPHLLQANPRLRATVLKVPHHGSRLGQAGEAFFRAVKPAVAVLSVGHAHGLPAAETMQALDRTRAVVYATREEGSVHLRTDGRRLEVRTFKHPAPIVFEP
jgi:competence protein ComEC